MKASLFLAVTGAALAVAGPVRALDKRALETQWVEEVVTVTVTAGNIPTQAPEPPAPAPQKPKEPVAKIEKQKKPEPEPEPEPKPAPEPTYTQVQPEEPKEKPKPKPTQAPPPSNGGGSYEETMLYHHNIHRANHSASALKWDSTLASYAERSAKTCVFEHDMDQGSGGYGQNLASFGASGDMSSMQLETAAKAVTDQWYNGEFDAFAPYYGQSSPSMSNFMKWGHFSQILWQSTTKVGCATVQCPAGTVLSMDGWYTVCNYNPAGNFAGKYADNVGEPSGERTVTI